MKCDSSDDIESVPGVGSAALPRLNRLGIQTVKDLLYFVPRKYRDFSKQMPIAEVVPNTEAIIGAKILDITTERTARKRMQITSALLDDGSATIKAIWFNQPFLADVLKTGTQWIFAGAVKKDFSGVIQFLPTTHEKEAKIVPVYSETTGLTSKMIRNLVGRAAGARFELVDSLPAGILQRYRLPKLADALWQVHFPSHHDDIRQGRQRLAIDELLLLILTGKKIKKDLQNFASPKIIIDKKLVTKFSKSLPFELTGDQKKAVLDVLGDLAKNKPMNRLLAGDVGSGKTAVALFAALQVIRSGYQVAWLAPTEILANQHFETAKKLLNSALLFERSREPIPRQSSGQDSPPELPRPARDSESKNNKSVSFIKIQLVTAATRNKIIVRACREHTSPPELPRPARDSESKNNISIDDTQLIIGTHAVLNRQFENLGLVIVDEQHRFGVKQRAKLIHLSIHPSIYPSKLVPHLLSMTATPIPRTLALTIYGDLDVSYICEKPPGRQKIISKIINPLYRQKAYQFIKQEIAKGRQAFIICPIIESAATTLSETLFDEDKKAVESEYRKLSCEIFPELKIGKLHGRMKSVEKEAVMKEFVSGKLDVLVSTAVVEVGIDVPNAAVMMIEGAERFGLAQLHQFRGRVGRSFHQSYCLLFPDSWNEKIEQRLRALTVSDDGFALAQKDLEIRGPGEFFGTAQHGVLDLKVARLTDIDTVELAQKIAKIIDGEGIEQYPVLAKQVEANIEVKHLE